MGSLRAPGSLNYILAISEVVFFHRNLMLLICGLVHFQNFQSNLSEKQKENQIELKILGIVTPLVDTMIPNQGFCFIIFQSEHIADTVCQCAKAPLFNHCFIWNNSSTRTVSQFPFLFVRIQSG